MSYQATAASSMYGSNNSSSPAAGSASSGAQGASAAGGAAGAPAPISARVLVYHVDIVFIIAFGAFVLTMLPRVLAMLARPAHFFTAFLRGPSKGEYTGALVREYENSGGADGFHKKGMESTSAFSLYSSEGSSTAHLVRPVAPRSASGAPPRVRSWLTYTHPAIVHAFNHPFAPGVTLAKAIVLLGYMGVVLFAVLVDSNPLLDPNRAGWVATSQIPVVIALATKNNVLSWLSSKGYDKLNYIHQFSGGLAVTVSNIHAIGHIAQWVVAGTFKQNIAIPKYSFGLMAMCAMNFISFGSSPAIRQKCYSLFMFTHITGFACLSVALYNHQSVTWNYIYAALGLYGFDLLLRTMRTRATTAYVTAHPSLNNGTTHVHIPSVTKGFRAGQHIRIRFIDPSSGAFGWIMALLFARTRPFSVSAKPNGSGVELLVKKNGSSTRELFQMAGGGQCSVNEKAATVELGQVSRRIKCLIEGPYGGHAATMFDAYSGALLVAGGSGVSFILSLLDDLVAKHVEGRSRTRAIEVVWSISDPNSLIELLPTIRPLLRARLSPDGVPLRVQMTVHYTRALCGSMPDVNLLPEGLYLRPGRPDMARCLKSTVERTLDSTMHGGRSDAQGVIASCCGPPTLDGDMSKALGGLDYSLWKQVGGVEIASEAFGW